MKLTGDLKKKVDAAASRDEARDTIANAGMELTDDELEQVAGGQWFRNAFEPNPRQVVCPNCGMTMEWDDVDPASAACLYCHEPLTG